MAKILKVKFQNNCVGCEMCVLETQRQLKKVGFEGSLIRILKNKPEKSKFLEYFIELDPRINNTDIERIKAICPKRVFEVEEGEPHGFNK